MTEKPNDPDRLESPTEQLLRAALAARADQVTAQSLRPAAPPTQRMRKIRPFHVVTTIAMFGLAASLAVGVLNVGGDTVAKRDEAPPAATVTASETPTSSPSPSDGASPSANTEAPAAGAPSSTGSPSAPVTTPYTYQGVKFQLPEGWKTKESSDHTCLVSPGEQKKVEGFGCLPYGIYVQTYQTDTEVHHATWPSEGELDADSGWAHQPGCYSWDNPHFMAPDGKVESQKTLRYDRQSVTLAGRAATRATWDVKCTSGDTFTGRMWGLRKEQVFLVANGLSAEYEEDLQAILASMDVSAKPAVKRTGEVSYSWSADPGCKETWVKDGFGNDIDNLLGHAQRGDVEELTAYYRKTPGVTPEMVAQQQEIWKKPGVLAQLAVVLGRTHFAKTNGGRTYPAFTTASQPGCSLEKDDLKALDVAKAADYKGVRTSFTMNNKSYAWQGVTLG